MKKLLSAFILAATVASCSTDDTPFDDTVTPELVSPAFFMQVSTANGAQPFTGVVTISPLTNGTLQYFGNYVNRNLTPFSGYYFVKDGTLYEDKKNLELTLPLGTYDMVYWGTPKYEEPIYANPALREPSYSIGGDMSAQAFSLLQIPGDTTYYPTYDLAYAKRPVNVGTDDLDVALQRVVAGLKIIIKDRNDEMLHSGIYRWERNDQRYCHAFPLHRHTGTPSFHQTARRPCEKFQANAGSTFASQYQAHSHPDRW